MMKMVNKQLSIRMYIISWLILAVISGCLLGWRIPALISLKEHGVPCEAEVIRVSTDIHNTFKYSYVIDNKTYEGVSQIIDSAPRVGSKVAITYLPDFPNFSYAGDIESQIDNDQISALLAVLLLPSFAVAVNILRSNWRKGT